MGGTREDQGPSKEEGTFKKPEEIRRDFLKKMALLGGGLLYTGPGMKVFAGGGGQLSPGAVFDISLPARYTIEGGQGLWITLPQKPPELVLFEANGEVILTPTEDKAIANVTVVTLSLVSMDPNPLAIVGENTGRITAEIKNQLVGSLYLRTGALREHDIPIEISTEIGPGVVQSVVKSSNAVVGKDTNPADSAKCTKGDDIEILIGNELPTLAQGQVFFKLLPMV